MGHLRRLLHRLATPRRARCPLCFGRYADLIAHEAWAHSPAEWRQYDERTKR